MNEIGNVSKDLVMTHLAIFERPLNLGSRTYIRDSVASCVTFRSQERVPAGINYHVTEMCFQLKMLQIVYRFCFSLACM